MLTIQESNKQILTTLYNNLKTQYSNADEIKKVGLAVALFEIDLMLKEVE